MACVRHLLLLLSLLPMSMAWKPKSLFLFNKVSGHPVALRAWTRPHAGSLGIRAPSLQCLPPRVWSGDWKGGCLGAQPPPQPWGPQDG